MSLECEKEIIAKCEMKNCFKQNCCILLFLTLMKTVIQIHWFSYKHIVFFSPSSCILIWQSVCKILILIIAIVSQHHYKELLFTLCLNKSHFKWMLFIESLRKLHQPHGHSISVFSHRKIVQRSALECALISQRNWT